MLEGTRPSSGIRKEEAGSQPRSSGPLQCHSVNAGWHPSADVWWMRHREGTATLSSGLLGVRTPKGSVLALPGTRNTSEIPLPMSRKSERQGRVCRDVSEQPVSKDGTRETVLQLKGDWTGVRGRESHLGFFCLCSACITTTSISLYKVLINK